MATHQYGRQVVQNPHEYAADPPRGPQGANGNFVGQGATVLPGLDTRNLPHSKAPFEYTQSTIPGLSFATPNAAPAWLPPPQQQLQANPAPGSDAVQSARPFVASSRSQASASNSRSNAPVAPKQDLQQPFIGPPDQPRTASASDDEAEEGELTESGVEDLYEPYLEPNNAYNTTNPQSQSSCGDNDDYDPANPDGAAAWSTQAAAPAEVVSAEPGRERSRSYSPYLSPNEDRDGTINQGPAPHHLASASNVGSAAPKTNDLAAAKKRAQAAILRLWPLEVRYQHYVDEGIDQKVVQSLFTSLGLDTKSATDPPREQQSPTLTHPKGSSKAPATQPSTDAPTGPSSVSKAVPAGSQDKSEERKDRIARLLAAKAAKPASPLPDTQQPVPRPPAASNTDAASKKAEKERLLQQKLEALQKSRALRAQKAAEKSNDIQASPELPPAGGIQLPSQAPRQEGIATQVPVTIGSLARQPEPTPRRGSAPEQAGPIPGLNLSTGPQTNPINPRKRPVASDLNEISAPPPYKRTFTHHRVETPLVIDVSDESDDEDVEMEISSPVDDVSVDRSSANTPQLKTARHGTLTLLANKNGQRNATLSASSTPGPTQRKHGDPAKLERITQDIDEMKRRIAEAERRKQAKMPSNDSPAHSSSTDAAVSNIVEPEVPPPLSVRPQSIISTPGQIDSPPPRGADIQRTLPRPATAPDVDRSQRIRAVSESLPALDTKLRGKTIKLQLLESQLARLRKEVDEMVSEKTKLALELEQLEKEEDETSPVELSQSPGMRLEPLESPNPAQARDHQVPVPNGLVKNDTSLSPEASAAQPATSGESILKETSSVAMPETAALNQEAIVQPVEPSMPTSVAFSGRPKDVPPRVEPAEVQSAEMEEAPQDEEIIDAQSDDDDAMSVDTSSSDEGEYDPPEPSAVQLEPLALEMQAGASTVLEVEKTGPPTLAVTDLQPPQTPQAPLSPASDKEPDGARTCVTDNDPDLSGAEDMVMSGGDQASSPGQSQAKSSREATERTGFAPYESVLKEFLSYRFHRNFQRDVKGGLRSQTYSNKINPSAMCCLDDLLGRCPKGDSCTLQHLDPADIPDSQILLQLGNAERLEGNAQERYIEGLRSLLSEFKAKQSKDFDVISRAIIDYRSQFYGDESRVLPLGKVDLSSTSKPPLPS